MSRLQASKAVQVLAHGLIGLYGKAGGKDEPQLFLAAFAQNEDSTCPGVSVFCCATEANKQQQGGLLFPKTTIYLGPVFIVTL